MITIQQLTFHYPRSPFHLQIPDLEIEAGRATAIVGPSGSGKTTLLHLTAGILSAESGTIKVGDDVVSEMTDTARRQGRLQKIGMIFQNFELIEYLTVIDNVLLPCRIGNAVKLTAEIKDRATDLLESAGLAAHTAKSVTKLSQGERQRVAICRALLTNPNLLLADEPTGNLDPATSAQVLELLLNRVRENNATLVMVTHDHTLLPHFDHVVDFTQFLKTPTQKATT